SLRGATVPAPRCLHSRPARRSSDLDEDVFAVYLRAKAQADADVRASGLHYTIVRPGMLSDEPGHGRVHAARHVERGAIPRDDVRSEEHTSALQSREKLVCRPLLAKT